MPSCFLPTVSVGNTIIDQSSAMSWPNFISALRAQKEYKNYIRTI